MADEPKEELESSTPSSEEEPTTDSSTEESPTEEVEEEETVEEPSVPLSRLRKERDKRRDLEKELDALKKPAQQIPQYQPPQAPNEKEEVDKYIRQKAREEFETLQEAKVREEKEADEELDKEIQDVQELYKDFEEKPVLQIMKKYGLTSVANAYSVWKDMKANKPEPSKPKMPQSSRTTDETPKETTGDVFDHSLSWIVEQAKEEARKLQK